MLSWNRCAKINIKVLIILIIITVAIGASLFAARQIRRNILSEMSLNAGEAAFEKKDWPAAYKNFRGYLGRNPDDVEILKKYAKAAMSIRPLDAKTIGGAIAAYRRVMQLDPLDEIAYDKLAMLYAATGNFEELAYIARNRIAEDPNDREAQLSLAEALIQLNKTQEAEEKLQTFIDELEALLPDKHVEYVRACLIMSKIILALDDNSNEANKEALEKLNEAVKYDLESVEALASRARFYRVTTNVSDPNAEERLAAARKDLDMADDLNTENPRIRLFLAEEWIAHGELDRAAAELRAAESLPQETLEEHFFDLNDWTVVRFLLASELAIRRGTTTEGASLADEALTALKEKRHRVRILPSAIRLYVIADKSLKAREYLDEYIDILNTQQGQAESRHGMVYLRALVAKAEDDSYAVIDALQSAIVSDASRPELWGLLAEAFSRTDQTRRAVSALIKYLRLRPQDAEMRQQLTKEYLKLWDWGNALKAARLAESLDPTDIVLKLLRIEASINVVAERQEVTAAERQAAWVEESGKLAQLRKEHPDSIDIRILQAIIANYLEDPDMAEMELKLAIDEFEESLRAEMQLSRFYYRTKRIAEAISTCQSACENHSEVAEPWLSLSGLYVANKDYDSAHRCLKKALDAVVGKWEKRSVSMSLALLELTHGDIADRASGISILSEVAAQDKREIRARTLLLSIREVREDKAKAQKLIDEIQDAEGESGLMWRLYQSAMWLASDEWRSKQQDIAAYLQYCINSDPEWSSPPLILAEMYEKLEDSRRVEDIYRQALVRNPSATDIVDKLITLLDKQRRFSDTEEVLQQSATNSRFAIILSLRTGNFSRAIEELKLRVSNDDRDANSRILLARLIYRQDKDKDQALKYLNEAEAITSGSIAITEAITAARVSIWRTEGETKKAQQILDNYVAARDDFSAYWMRAMYYITEEGELERAEKDYRKLTTFAEQGAMGYELLSNFYGRNEKLDKAIEELEEGLKAYPENLGLKRRLMKTLLLPGPTQERQRAFEILTALEKQLKEQLLPEDPELMKFRALQILEELTPQSFMIARGKLEDVIKLEPTAVDAHLILIGIAMEEGEYETARYSTIRAIGSNPDNLPLLLARGRAELELGNMQMAVELARLVLQKDSSNAGALGLLLDAAIRSGNDSLIGEATALARLILEEDPNKTEVRDIIVAKAVESKDRTLLEEARALIESALASDPTDEKQLLSRARVLVAMELPQSAIPELEAYCQTKEGSSSVAAIVTLADLYRISGDMEQAKQKIEQAERIAPNSQTVIHSRLIWLVAQNRFEELAGISSEYLSATEQNLTTLIRAASVLASLDSMALKKEGLKLYEHAVTLSPTSKDARLGLAFTFYQTGNAERAEKLYQELLRQYPNNIQILNDLAWILQEHYQRYAAALELANRAVSLAPDNLYVLDTRGTILSNLPGRLADAKKDFERLVELSLPDTRQRAKALLQLGSICSKLNALDQAKRHLKNALEIDQKIDIFTPDERSEITRILQIRETQAVNN